MLLPGQTIKSNDAIGSQQIPITPPGQHEDALLVQLDNVEDSQLVSQGENVNTTELRQESPEVSENLENSFIDNARNDKQFVFGSPSPQVSTASFTPQLNVSHTTPPQHTAENSEYAQLLAPKEDENLSHVDVPPSGVQPRVFPPQPDFPSLTTSGTGNGASLFGNSLYSNNYTLKPQTTSSFSSFPSQSSTYSSLPQYTVADESAQGPKGGYDNLSIASSEDEKQSGFPPAIATMTLQQLQAELSRAHEHNQQLYTHYFLAYRQVQELEQENERLNAATQGLEKAEELKKAFVAYLKEQAQQLTQLFQQENETQKIEELVEELSTVNECLRAGELNVTTIKRLNELWKKTEEIRNKPNENAPSRELGEENEQIEELNAEVEKLKKDLAAKNTEVQQLQKRNKELEAKKQPTEQPKQGNGAQYTAAAGFGLAAGLAAFIALERTVRLDIWTMVGIAVASALLVSGGTYLALKPSTQMNEAGTQKVNGEVPAKS